MANFLDSLRAWGESLFTAKRSWISAQAFPKTVQRTDLDISTRSFIPPSDGFIGIYSNDRVDAYQNIESKISTRICISARQNENAWACSGTIPVKKGGTVSFSGYDITELWFIPTEGSQ